MASPDGTSSWRPSGIVTLTTDFGLVDPYVGMLHGVVLGACPGARVVDLCHGVPPQAVRVGAFFLAHSVAYFPPGTVHVAVVDPGVGSDRRLLVALDGGSCFLAPDNGLLSSFLSPAASWRELDAARFALAGASRTFHGRDLLAPAAAAIAAGLDPLVAGRPLTSPPVAGAGWTPRRAGSEAWEAEVLFADRYGNLVLGVRREDLEGALSSWSVEAGEQRIPFAGTYADVARGEALALVDSYGAIEIAVREGSAAARLALEPGRRVTLRRRR